MNGVTLTEPKKIVLYNQFGCKNLNEFNDAVKILSNEMYEVPAFYEKYLAGDGKRLEIRNQKDTGITMQTLRLLLINLVPQVEVVKVTGSELNKDAVDGIHKLARSSTV
jgi:hypothetical protein